MSSSLHVFKGLTPLPRCATPFSRLLSPHVSAASGLHEVPGGVEVAVVQVGHEELMASAPREGVHGPHRAPVVGAGRVQGPRPLRDAPREALAGEPLRGLAVAVVVAAHEAPEPHLGVPGLEVQEHGVVGMLGIEVDPIEGPVTEPRAVSSLGSWKPYETI